MPTTPYHRYRFNRLFIQRYNHKNKFIAVFDDVLRNRKHIKFYHLFFMIRRFLRNFHTLRLTYAKKNNMSKKPCMLTLKNDIRIINLFFALSSIVKSVKRNGRSLYWFIKTAMPHISLSVFMSIIKRRKRKVKENQHYLLLSDGNHTCNKIWLFNFRSYVTSWIPWDWKKDQWFHLKKAIRIEKYITITNCQVEIWFKAISLQFVFSRT